MAVVICPPCSPHCFSLNVTAELQKTRRNSRIALCLAFLLLIIPPPQKSTIHDDILPLKEHLAALSKNTHKVLTATNGQKLTSEQIMFIIRQAVQQQKLIEETRIATMQYRGNLQQIGADVEKEHRG